MLFIKKHIIEVDKPKDYLSVALKSSVGKIKVTEVENGNLFGRMKNTTGRGFNICSNISFKTNNGKTQIIFINEFDTYTNIFTVLTALIFWIALIYKLINGSELISFETILFFIIPIIGYIISKLSFNIYENEAMNMYQTLINTDVPN